MARLEISKSGLTQHPAPVSTANINDVATVRNKVDSAGRRGKPRSVASSQNTDIYFSADVETDGPIPGPFSMLSFALVYAGRFDGDQFERPTKLDQSIYRELRPISNDFQLDALRVNRLDRDRLIHEGDSPETAMTQASDWIRSISRHGRPVLVAYPLSFDWTWLYWYFMRFCEAGSPFSHSRGFDLKTAFAVKARIPVGLAGRSHLFESLRSHRAHSHHALADAIEQAEIFANIFEWEGVHGSNTRQTTR